MQRNRIEWNRIVLDDFYFCTNVRCQRHTTNYEIFEQRISVRAVDVGSLLYTEQADAVATTTTTTTTLFHLGKLFHLFRKLFVHRESKDLREKGGKARRLPSEKPHYWRKNRDRGLCQILFPRYVGRRRVRRCTSLKLAVTRRGGYNGYSQ